MIGFTGLAFLKNDNIIWEDVTNKINLCGLIFQEEDSVLLYVTLVREVVNALMKHQC